MSFSSLKEPAQTGKTLGTALAASLVAATAFGGTALAEDVKIGVVGGISGPIAALAPPMIDASKLAVAHVNEQGGLLGGNNLVAVIGDSSCSQQGGTDAANKAVNVEGVVAMVGPYCSGATLAAANSVTVPAGVVLVSPSATSPELTKLDDKDLVFRTAPSDSYQGQALARKLLNDGTNKVAVAYLNNDYGKGFAEAFRSEFEGKGGEIAGFSAHEEGKASYRSELAELASGGADTLVLIDYGDGTGLTILRQALENGFFENFVGGDGMKTDALIEALGRRQSEDLHHLGAGGCRIRWSRDLQQALRRGRRRPDRGLCHHLLRRHLPARHGDREGRFGRSLQDRGGLARGVFRTGRNHPARRMGKGPQVDRRGQGRELPGCGRRP